MFRTGECFQIWTGFIRELGPHASLYNLGDEQNMVFDASSVGPLLMTPAERLESRDNPLLHETITKDRMMADLLVNLRKQGADTTSRRFLKPELVDLSLKNNITISITVDNIKVVRATPS